MDILHRIAADRRERVARNGAFPDFCGEARPDLPVITFARDPFLICEIKKRSPSKGGIDETLDPVVQARNYVQAGVRSISVLTEEKYFGGSLADLRRVKNACPDTAILRKDFLLTPDDVKASFYAGADAFLLIAALLERGRIRDMAELGLSLGMQPLVELHDQEDVDKVRPFRPALCGINCRDLRTFAIDPLRPHKIRSYIDWDCRVVYESGIRNLRSARFALASGFDGLLVGEAVVRSPELAGELLRGFGAVGTGEGEAASNGGGDVKRGPGLSSWARLYADHRYRPGRPLVKICGITRREDAEAALRLGADMLGFILADSPRRVTADFIRGLADLAILKCGVVVLGRDEDPPPEIDALRREGVLDFLQLHGDESPAATERLDGYKALRLRGPETIERIPDFAPRPVLVDAFEADRAGGTGSRLSPDLVRAAKTKGPLWLAGGITPDNVAAVVREFEPDLIDLSSGVESAPGIKDHGKLETLFRELNRYG